jgi:hypothetical protein
MPVPVTLRSKELFCGRSNAGIASSNTAEEMGFSSLKFVLRYASNGLCHKLITRSEEFYRVSVCV